MPMTAAYLNAIRDHGQALITHIALFGNGVEAAGGGYARQPVTWADDGDGVSRPSANIVFDVDAGTVVDEWRGYSALTGGTNYGGAALSEVTFGNDGTYTLLAASTSIGHTAT